MGLRFHITDLARKEGVSITLLEVRIYEEVYSSLKRHMPQMKGVALVGNDEVHATYKDGNLQVGMHQVGPIAFAARAMHRLAKAASLPCPEQPVRK